MNRHGDIKANSPPSNLRRSATTQQVVLAREAEVRYWCARFGCSEVLLHRAIKAVGNHPERIGEYLRTKARAARARPPQMGTNSLLKFVLHSTDSRLSSLQPLSFL